jgi:hypothetical protein
LEASDGGDQRQCQVLDGVGSVGASFLISVHRFAFFLTCFSTNPSPIHKVWGSFSLSDALE